MAQTTAVIRATMATGASATTDFTSSGFGTPNAALFIWSSANPTNNPQADYILGMGFWDGTNQRGASSSAEDNLGTTVTTRWASDSEIFGYYYSGTHEASVASAITDGIRLTNGNAIPFANYVTCILIKGVSAKLLTFTTNTTQDASTESASIGFAPELLLITSVGSTTADIGDVHDTLCFGIAEKSGNTDRMISQANRWGQGTSVVTTQYKEDRCCGIISAGSYLFGGEITTWGSDTFTMTTRDGSSSSIMVFVLALGGADLSFDTGILTTPTATGTDAVTTSIQPDALLLALTSATSTTIEQDDDAGGWVFGLGDGPNEYSHNKASEDNVTTSNEESNASASQILDLDNVQSGTFTDLCDATIDSFNATDFTLNYSVVDSTARKGLWLAFDSAEPALQLVLDADGTIAASIENDTADTPVWDHGGDVPDGASSDYIQNDNSETSGTGWFSLSDVPSDFDSMANLTIKVDVWAETAVSDDTITLTARVYDADNDTTNPLTAESGNLATDADTTRTQRRVTFGTLAGTKAQWNSAYIRFTWTYTKSTGPDNANLRLYGCSLDGTYTRSAGGLSIPIAAYHYNHSLKI